MSDSLPGTTHAELERMMNESKVSIVGERKIVTSRTTVAEIDLDPASSTPIPGEFKPDKDADWRPTLDICEDSSEYLFIVEVPGMVEENIQVDASDGFLQISCEAHLHGTEKGKVYTKVERDLGTGRRMFRLPADADSGSIQWDLFNGLLHVHVPKTVLVGAITEDEPLTADDGREKALPSPPESCLSNRILPALRGDDLEICTIESRKVESMPVRVEQ